MKIFKVVIQLKSRSCSLKDHKKGENCSFIHCHRARGAEINSHTHTRTCMHDHIHTPPPPCAAVSSVSHVWRTSQQRRWGDESWVCNFEQRSSEKFISDTPRPECVCVFVCVEEEYSVSTCRMSEHVLLSSAVHSYTVCFHLVGHLSSVSKIIHLSIHTSVGL